MENIREIIARRDKLRAQRPVTAESTDEIVHLNRLVEHHILDICAETIGAIQRGLPWGAHVYGPDYSGRTDPQREVQHLLGHMMEHLGGLASWVGQMDRVQGPAVTAAVAGRHQAEKQIANLVWVILEFANRWPGGPIDVQLALRERMLEKMG